jgi:ABC-type transport system involved in multi-copper enzyme maturation permease subunit
LPRWQIVAAKALALTISTIIIFAFVSLVSFFVFQAIGSQIETDVVGLDLILAVFSGWPLVFAVSMLALFLAAFAPSRRIAAMIGAAILVVSYFGDNLANSTTALEPFEPFFLFTYLDSTAEAVTQGQATGDVLVLLGIGVVSFLLAVFFFQRRNLTVGAWPWQRAQVV